MDNKILTEGAVAKINGVPVLLISVAILVLGTNLQSTLLGVRAGIEGITDSSIGMMMSTYYVGFVLGSLLLPRLISSVGHIRTYAALASTASALTLAYILIITVPFWVLLRFFHGLCYAGMILVIESWLNRCADKKNRGRLLATYGLVFWGCSALSQMLLPLASPEGFVLFCLVSILVSLAMVPLTLAPSKDPVSVFSKKTEFRQLQGISPIGVLGVFVSGLCMGSVYGMGPVFAHNIDLSTEQISLFMFAIMGGTMISQWPLGKLSDKVDRRLVILFTLLGAGVISMLIGLQNDLSVNVVLIMALMYGALAFPLYSISVAHVNDLVSPEESVGTAATLILIQGIGSAIGPSMAGFVMGNIGAHGLFIFVGSVMLSASVLTVVIIPHRKSVSGKIKRGFTVIPRVSYVLLHTHSKRKSKQKRPKVPKDRSHIGK
ncbi:MFS transporter [Chitinispirillales bacterium ANBcel5]|uniref:MFS transporter n=1 Tax=Cellulosispirillum alkaliphilum TaxID=3039283 RepID=UPI002A555BF8|nr:MFS transporter [Chitinispirillales bacterium ANBcel5]